MSDEALEHEELDFDQLLEGLEAAGFAVICHFGISELRLMGFLVDEELENAPGNFPSERNSADLDSYMNRLEVLRDKIAQYLEAAVQVGKVRSKSEG